MGRKILTEEEIKSLTEEETKKYKKWIACRKWREKNKDKIAEYQKSYYIKKNPDKLIKTRKNKTQEERRESINRARTKYREKNRQLLREKNREYYRNNPTAKESKKKYNDKNKEKKKFYKIEKNYGLTKKQYCEILERQEYCCAICLQNVEEISKKTLDVDHNHKTNEIRGLLCGSCNRALGLFKDNKDSLLRAIKYLENKLVLKADMPIVYEGK